MGAAGRFADPGADVDLFQIASELQALAGEVEGLRNEVEAFRRAEAEQAEEISRRVLTMLLERGRAYLVAAGFLLVGPGIGTVYNVVTTPRVSPLTIGEHAAGIAADELRKPIEERVNKLDGRLDALESTLRDSEARRVQEATEQRRLLEALAALPRKR